MSSFSGTKENQIVRLLGISFAHLKAFDIANKVTCNVLFTSCLTLDSISAETYEILDFQGYQQFIQDMPDSSLAWLPISKIKRSDGKTVKDFSYNEKLSQIDQT